MRHIVSRDTRKYPNPSNERSERTSTQTAKRVKLVRVLVSIYAVRGDGKASNEPAHKEKFCVPVSGTQNFYKVVIKTEMNSNATLYPLRHKDSSVQKGIGQNFDLNIARVSKNSKGGVDVYSIRTQDSWSHEWPKIER